MKTQQLIAEAYNAITRAKGAKYAPTALEIQQWIDENHSEKYVLIVAWGSDAAYISSEHGFDYLINNSDKLGVIVKTYVFDTERELAIFKYAIDETIGWDDYTSQSNKQ